MKKIIKHISICIITFTLVMLAGFFIAGNTNIFSWGSADRFVVVAFSLVISFVIIMIHEDN